LVSLTHPDAPHDVRPTPQTHAVTPPLVWHVAPEPQTTPQAPQLKLSFVKFTHAAGLAHRFGRLAGQLQAPAAHTPLRAHALPQAPQLAGSLVSFTHPLGHTVLGEGQLHVPATQVSPVRHALPQVPQ
jgi:hypothetical protein